MLAGNRLSKKTDNKLIVLGDFGTKELRAHHEVSMETSPQSRWDKTIKIARVIDHLERYYRRRQLDLRDEVNNRQLYTTAQEWRYLAETVWEMGIEAMDYAKPLVGSSSQQRMFAAHLFEVRHKWRFINNGLEKRAKSVLNFVISGDLHVGKDGALTSTCGSAEQWAVQQGASKEYGIERLREALQTVTEKMEKYRPPEKNDVDTAPRITP